MKRAFILLGFEKLAKREEVIDCFRLRLDTFRSFGSFDSRYKL
mgnify:FL=1